ncbi:P-type DNA transfer ATPase VirB11 [Phyllobacterium sp. 22229]|uniref:Type IV secretion system protein n=1 Tax=Phyllobacterium myrsinacearum TaxID=28101 RepID=A0A2S9J9T3_9HYPH|nr:P-type DNA transfer ATPase VirB11 [Phyllobacterium myrsinacearum]PRD49519.1 P-type DNA transfer ATPase VirB11 [Phyllobacterium myrsinacearum]PWV83480.1 type IV secretion system protein VirB11 [Phyllobacterium myrsinacearum]RZU96784.1 type IV secretion system protein VirB11 [Phyllobacterium myrsinacearum]
MTQALPVSPARYFLDEALVPIRHFLDDAAIGEIACQRPGEVWIEQAGRHDMVRHRVDALDGAAIALMAERAAAHSNQMISAEQPLLSVTLPGGERAQFVLHPTSATGHCFAIRKQNRRRLTLADYDALGAFRSTRVATNAFTDAVDVELSRLLRNSRIRPFLECAARHGRSMIISGGTSTGKTTFLNAMLSAIAPHERFVILQDTLELEPSQENVVLLTASKGGQGSARVTMTSLLAAALRLRPDRIFMGEIRGEEAFDFLNAINTGHPGSMTTIHANSPRHAFDRLSTLVLNSGIRMDRADIIGYIRSIVPIVVQLTKGGEHGARGVSEIFFADEVDCHGKRKHA